MGIFVSLEALEAHAQRKRTTYIVVKRERHINLFWRRAAGYCGWCLGYRYLMEVTVLGIGL